MKRTSFLIILGALELTLLLPTSSSIRASETPVMPGKAAWPADKVPADLPAYTDGKVANWGNTGANELMIKVAETSDKALRAYLESLKTKGWAIVSTSVYESRAQKGAYSVALSIQAATWLQITVTTAKTGAWPGADQIPPALTPPQKCTLADTGVNSLDENNWSYTFTCVDMSEKEANAYLDELLKSGWNGDRSQLLRKANWRGKPYELSLEPYETTNGRATFILQFGPASQ
jgi:hypothetical protein